MDARDMYESNFSIRWHKELRVCNCAPTTNGELADAMREVRCLARASRKGIIHLSFRLEVAESIVKHINAKGQGYAAINIFKATRYCSKRECNMTWVVVAATRKHYDLWRDARCLHGAR